MMDKVANLNFGGVGKTLHGHAKFELFDAATGELVQKVEKDNLVTNALQRFVNNVVGSIPGQMGTLVMPVAEKALGGIMLFDGELEADADNCAFPMDVSLVAFGRRATDLDNTKYGSLNAAESGPIYNGYRSVWDFSTSQANGTIRSAALCNSNAGPFSGFAGVVVSHNILNASGNLWSNMAPVYIDPDGEHVYIVSGTGTYTSTNNHGVYTYHNSCTFYVYRERIPLAKYRVGDSVDAKDIPPDLVATHTISVTTTGSPLLDYGSPYYAASFGHDGKVYVIWALGNAEGDGTVIYFTLNAEDGTFSKSDLHTLSLPNAFLCRSHGTASNGYVYLISNDRQSVYKVQLSNTANVTQIDLPENFYFRNSASLSGYSIIPCPGGGVKIAVYTDAANGQAGYYDHYVGYINANGVVTLNGAYSLRSNADNQRGSMAMGLWDYDHMQSYGWNGASGNSNNFTGGAGYPVTNYLGTIANLTQPIEKNSSQTLKVTYELRDVEDEGSSS